MVGHHVARAAQQNQALAGEHCPTVGNDATQRGVLGVCEQPNSAQRPDFGARFDTAAAPWWLRAWFATPLLDRFAYPVLVRRGYGHLSPHPGIVPDAQAIADATKEGWRIDQS
jgi:hypothetical protein